MRNSDLRENEIMNNTADENCAADTGMKEIGGEKSLEILEDENRRLLALMQTECETEEDLSNLADIVPGLVGMHKSLQNHFGAGFKKAYSSKVLEKHGVSDKQKGVEIIGEVFSVEVTADKPIEENNVVPATDNNYNKNDIKNNNNDGAKKSAVIPAEILPDEIIEVHTMGAEVAPVGSRVEEKPILRNAASADEGSFHSAESVTGDKTPEYCDQSSPFRIIPSSQVMIPELTSFTPATGCRDASDFIVRCFVARLRIGITVMKHGRTRFYSSHMRVIHVHEDGRSLSWRPANVEKGKKKKKANPPRLDLQSCLEVRHAWTPDPLNPLFTGTPILRRRCEPENAHKSFSLIFPERTIDMTAVTADQCRVLMEGFSALIYRLQTTTATKAKHGMSNYLFFDDIATDTETMTNKTGPRSMQDVDD
mmetsp:Transcript_24621/g.35309  ORF Transcript_24621/g.35309 Transcript_24621/m.35309 type:complete len:423 (-) Transcript_24621:881-2149(-)